MVEHNARSTRIEVSEFCVCGEMDVVIGYKGLVTAR